MITILECKKSQLDILFKVAIQSYNDTYQYLWTDNGQAYLDQFYKKEDFEKELSAPDIFYFLIYDADKAIGYFKLKNNGLEPYSKTQCIEIDKLYLLKEYSGKGFGKAIIEFIILFCKKKNHSILWLKTMESSEARYFYERQEFIQTAKNYLDYPTMKEEYKWILTMVKTL
ncbi:GNAT family N-acetyltransferase [Flavobacterium aquidurense]|uniref:GNAT family N-acetyltransferase n=1 Tax=Flavobacterium aquidurense TaxID=362413 RepID=UPI0028576937|nr:GNAT family N-acetyltransferase [Flavobacterium aquidurense]MDR7370202.1 GNAT superfamily N-acetyltransferase [Flavobacterium aquidurense]